MFWCRVVGHCRSTVRLSHCVKCRSCHTARADSSRKRALCRLSRRTSSSSWCLCRCEAAASVSSAATRDARPHAQLAALAVFAVLLATLAPVGDVVETLVVNVAGTVSDTTETSFQESLAVSFAKVSNEGSVLSIDGYWCSSHICSIARVAVCTSAAQSSAAASGSGSGAAPPAPLAGPPPPVPLAEDLPSPSSASIIRMRSSVSEDVLAEARLCLACRGDAASSCERRRNAASGAGDVCGDRRPDRHEPPVPYPELSDRGGECPRS